MAAFRTDQSSTCRRLAAVAFAMVALAATGAARSDATPGHGTWGVAYAPAERSAQRAAPAIVYLHGMWASPEDSCSYFARGATPFGFLVCPRGNAPLGQGRMWAGTYATVAPNVHAALDAAATLAPRPLDRSGNGTLIGYSNGAYFAVEIACAERGRWTGLVLLSMHLELEASRLKRAGVRRVLLGAGERDGARRSMEAMAERLRGEGLAARFMSLGPGGHEFPADMDERMKAALVWTRGEHAPGCGSDSCAESE
ncbi:MAG: hypothetical protein M3O50_09610 [Myxococcota bacterium]|nr:hypothetical protein [Myxococcota bacterium]